MVNCHQRNGMIFRRPFFAAQQLAPRKRKRRSPLLVFPCVFRTSCATMLELGLTLAWGMLERVMSGWIYGDMIWRPFCSCLACLLLGEFMFEDFILSWESKRKQEEARESKRKQEKGRSERQVELDTCSVAKGLWFWVWVCCGKTSSLDSGCLEPISWPGNL